MTETPKEYLARIGRKGGKNRGKNQTPEERREQARKAAEARWKKLNDTVDRIEAGAERLKKKLDAKPRKKKAQA